MQGFVRGETINDPTAAPPPRFSREENTAGRSSTSASSSSSRTFDRGYVVHGLVVYTDAPSASVLSFCRAFGTAHLRHDGDDIIDAGEGRGTVGKSIHDDILEQCLRIQRDPRSRLGIGASDPDAATEQGKKEAQEKAPREKEGMSSSTVAPVGSSTGNNNDDGRGTGTDDKSFRPVTVVFPRRGHAEAAVRALHGHVLAPGGSRCTVDYAGELRTRSRLVAEPGPAVRPEDTMLSLLRLTSSPSRPLVETVTCFALQELDAADALGAAVEQRLDELVHHGHRRLGGGVSANDETKSDSGRDCDGDNNDKTGGTSGDAGDQPDPQETALAVLAVVAVVTDMLSNSAAVRGAHKISTAITARLELIMGHLRALRRMCAGRGTDLCFATWIDSCLEVWEGWGFLTPAQRASFGGANP